MRLTTVDNNSHKLIVLRNCDFFPGWPSWGPVASPLASLSAAVLTSHSRYSVGLHVEHPGELWNNGNNLNPNHIYIKVKEAVTILGNVIY